MQKCETSLFLVKPVFTKVLLHSVSSTVSFRLCPHFLIVFHLTWMRFSRSTHLLMFFSLETLTFIIRTGLPILIELIDLVNTDFLNDLTQMVNFPSAISDNFPSRISDSDSHSPALLDLFLFSDASICSTVAFPPFGNSDHVVVSVSIDFPSYSLHDALFHHIA